MKDMLGCMVSKLSISYLGIPLGANLNRVRTWQPVIEKIKKRLSGWKMHMLSKAGRLVLIKYVLNNLALYYLSLLRMLKAVAKEIIAIQRRFFQGKQEGGQIPPIG